jgi:hypothetical protein
MLVRFAAAGLVGVSVLEAGLYAARCMARHQPIQVFHTLLLFLPLVLGIIVFIRSRDIAEWIENRFD